MNCVKCKAVLAADRIKCPRCGTPRAVAAPPALLVLLKDQPWLIALLSASALLTLWLATRRAPPPPPPPPVAAVAEPVPAPPPEPEPAAMPPLVVEPVAVAAPEPEPVRQPSSEAPPGPPTGRMLENGTFESDGGASSLPQGR